MVPLFDRLNDAVAQRIADTYSAITKDDSVTAAVRLATKDDNGDREYITAGRSDRMDVHRERNSVPIPANKGLPNKLRSKDCQGVLLIRDVQDAIESEEYMKTPNDDNGDCVSMLVAPVNGWESGQMQLVGILTVSSAKTAAFDRLHSELVKSFADALGFIYPILLTRLTSGRRLQSSAEMRGPHLSGSQQREMA